MDPAFSTLALSPALLTVAKELGFSTLTPIQAGAVPPLLAGLDVVGQSQTGSGKTVAFALPILERLITGQRELQAMVLCPTRELSAQVAREFRKWGRNLPGLSVLVLAGGEPVRGQKDALNRGVHVVIGTPGRVLDQLRRRHLRVHAVRTVVLDEAEPRFPNPSTLSVRSTNSRPSGFESIKRSGLARSVRWSMRRNRSRSSRVCSGCSRSIRTNQPWYSRTSKSPSPRLSKHSRSQI